MTATRKHAPRARSWSTEEVRIVGRYADAVIRGRYPSVLRASEDCRRDIEELNRRLLEKYPDLTGAVKSRGADNVYHMVQREVRRRSKAEGKVTWTGDEERLLREYVKAKLAGRYRTNVAAAAECWRELERRRRAAWSQPGRYYRRSRQNIVTRLTIILRESRRGTVPPTVEHKGPGKLQPGPAARIQQKRWRVLDRHVTGLLKGRYADGPTAARHCESELARLRQRDGDAGLTWWNSRTIHDLINRRARALGRRHGHTSWTPEEKALLDDHARRVLTGEYRYATHAGKACLAELARRRRADPANAAAYPPRTLTSIRIHLRMLLRHVAVPRPQAAWTAAEVELLERHARALIGPGRANVAQAALRCRAALHRLALRNARAAGIPRRAVIARSFSSVHQRLLVRAHELGAETRGASRWLPEELRLVDKWIDKYYQYRRQGMRWGRNSSVTALQVELKGRGYLRTFSACQSEMYERLRQRR